MTYPFFRLMGMYLGASLFLKVESYQFGYNSLDDLASGVAAFVQHLFGQSLRHQQALIYLQNMVFL